jgi:hypothetical protein
LPREVWEEHPRFATQALLLGSHDSFRRRSIWILERLRDLDPVAGDPRRQRRWVTRMSTDFDWWMRGMRGHERYEETKLYRYLAHRFGGSFEHLEAGHRVLNAHRERVEEAFRRSRAAKPSPDDHLERLIGELEAHRDVLLEHLREEEDFVIPQLLELAPDEFARYSNNPIRVLLREPSV